MDDDRATDLPSAGHSMTTRVIGGGRVGVRELLRAPDVDVALALLAFIGLLVNRSGEVRLEEEQLVTLRP